MEQHGFAEVNGTRLYYEVTGSGPPLVFIHGGTLDCRMWDGQFAVFSRHYRVIRYDVRGYGRSALPAGEPYSRVDDLKALLDYLGVTRTHLVGLSMGGSIILNFALLYPKMVHALVLVDSGLPGFPFSREFNAMVEAAQAAAGQLGIDTAREVWLGQPVFAPALERLEAGARLREIIAVYSGWGWVNTDPIRLHDPPAIERLEEITARTLVVLGERDLPDFHTIADVLHRRIPNARKVVLPGVGHLSALEDPEAFNVVTLEFLAAVSRA